MDQSRRNGWLGWVERAPRRALVALLTALVLGVALLHLWVTADLGFTLAYLLPIALASWRLGIPGAAITVAACAATWVLVHMLGRDAQFVPSTEALNVAMELGVFFAFGVVLAQLRRRVDDLERLARTDVLTGVLNRRAFREELAREIDRCRRFGQPFSLAYLDVDQFKAVNDRLGHQSGDELLAAVAHTLRSGTRRVDVVARLGGDEFALLLPGTDGFGAAVVMSKLRGVLATGLQRTFGVSVSIGCLSVLRQAPDIDQLIDAADQVMYAVKRSGRGQLGHEVWPAGSDATTVVRGGDRAAQ